VVVEVEEEEEEAEEAMDDAEDAREDCTPFDVDPTAALRGGEAKYASTGCGAEDEEVGRYDCDRRRRSTGALARLPEPRRGFMREEGAAGV
jgi:hypothetical protein